MVADARLDSAVDKLMAFAEPHKGLRQAVLTILDDTVKSDVAEEMLEAMQPVITQMQEIAALDRWLEHVPTNLTEEKIQLTGQAVRVKKRDDLIKTLLDQAAGIVKARSAETINERDWRYFQRMRELIDQGKTERAAADQVRREEIAAGRSPPQATTIKRIYHQVRKSGARK
jgi:hypothetical protein